MSNENPASVMSPRTIVRIMRDLATNRSNTTTPPTTSATPTKTRKAKRDYASGNPHALLRKSNRHWPTNALVRQAYAPRAKRIRDRARVVAELNGIFLAKKREELRAAVAKIHAERARQRAERSDPEWPKKLFGRLPSELRLQVLELALIGDRAELWMEEEERPAGFVSKYIQVSDTIHYDPAALPRPFRIVDSRGNTAAYNQVVNLLGIEYRGLELLNATLNVHLREFMNLIQHRDETINKRVREVDVHGQYGIREVPDERVLRSLIEFAFKYPNARIRVEVPDLHLKSGKQLWKFLRYVQSFNIPHMRVAHNPRQRTLSQMNAKKLTFVPKDCDFDRQKFADRVAAACAPKKGKPINISAYWAGEEELLEDVDSWYSEGI
ncbi:hypothetical protein BDV95DRAFT_624398 [Massariosphaeria phaeospora]|uniref:Uncharacterized protein n=1 Tax=Massariosphaeria phaeospora TaxID=100035 RepID=A0A7C8LZJ6_9PLEO|nr:hypothetical protein BDV95DRAFT_624398 [Massariosphaeria phaeospora]